MTHNHTPGLYPAVVRKDCELVSGSSVGSAPRDTERPTAPSITSNCRAWLVMANDVARHRLIAFMVGGRLFAAVRLIPPDFPIVAFLSHVFGGEGR